MNGWRCRIGLIVPSANTVAEVELPRLVPAGVSVHTARIPVVRGLANHEEELLQMSASDDLERAARSLADSSVDSIVYACTSGSLLGGVAHNSELEDRMSGVTGIPALTTSHAVVLAMKELGWRRIGMVTPYEVTIHAATKTYLETEGFDVVGDVGLEALPWKPTQSKSDMQPEVSYLLGKKLLSDYSDVDGLFISCTAFRTLESVPLLQEDFGVPVLSANHASALMAMKKGGLPVNLPKALGLDTRQLIA